MTDGEIRHLARMALLISSPEEKCVAVATLSAQVDVLALDPSALLPPVDEPGRPHRPELVPPAQVPRRSPGTRIGRAALIHAITHIELNAVNLALDAVARFRDLPVEFYRDWLRVAGEEARHYAMLSRHLALLGHGYGDFPAHAGLWEAACKTAGDPLARMALVPRVLEARGLDVNPGIQRRLAAAEDHEAVAILEVILAEEIGHVAIGNRWFLHLCAERRLDPQRAFREILARYATAPPRPPFNKAARLAAGFTAAELATWEA